MRIFYIGQLREGGTCKERMKALIDLGHEIVPFDTTKWLYGKNRLLRSISHRFKIGPYILGLNRALLSFTKNLNALDLIWIDKGEWIFPSTLESILSTLKVNALHFSLDPEFADMKFVNNRHFINGIPLYKWIVTTKLYEQQRYMQSGAQNVIQVLQGYDERFINYRKKQEDVPKWRSDVCFVGMYRPYHKNLLIKVAATGCDLKVWGPRWTRARRIHKKLDRIVLGDGLWGEDYLKALSNARIALGLLRKDVPETSTTRTFEIPAIGTFLLAERTSEHLELFEEGKEAEFFSDDLELADKIGFYLKNESARKKIADAGRNRCIKSGYSSKGQLKIILDKLKNS